MSQLFAEVLGSVGGIIAFLGALTVSTRAIFSQVNATKANTRALDTMTRLMEKIEQTQNEHGERLARLEGRR